MFKENIINLTCCIIIILPASRINNFSAGRTKSKDFSWTARGRTWCCSPRCSSKISSIQCGLGYGVTLSSSPTLFLLSIYKEYLNQWFNKPSLRLDLIEPRSSYHLITAGGAAFCDECYYEKILPKCFGCQRPITDRALKALDVQWHVKCFVCEVIV